MRDEYTFCEVSSQYSCSVEDHGTMEGLTHRAWPVCLGLDIFVELFDQHLVDTGFPDRSKCSYLLEDTLRSLDVDLSCGKSQQRGLNDRTRTTARA